MRLVYFAWVRERVGLADETVSLPADLVSVADVVGWLRTRGEGYAYAFENPAVVRTALDKVHARPDSAIAGASEIAFFPPMTGG